MKALTPLSRDFLKKFELPVPGFSNRVHLWSHAECPNESSFANDVVFAVM
jgi:hypothetical protein